MTTLKKRINISVPKSLEDILNKMSNEEGVPVATKALELLKIAVELEEDAYFEKITLDRGSKDSKYIPHDKIWN